MSANAPHTKPLGCHVLAIGAHPDDIEFICGGLLAGAAQRSYRIGLLDLSAGELASNGTVDERSAEAACAAKLLGAAFRECLHLPDGGLFAHGGYGANGPPTPESPVARVVCALRRHRPELVIAPASAERHPDHEQAHQLVRQAVFLAGLRQFDCGAERAPHRPAQVLYAPMRVESPFSLLVDISAHAELKYGALSAHVSQLRPPPSGTQTLISSQAVDLARARDRWYGAHLGVDYAEPYWMPNAIGVTDPVAHFRANSYGSSAQVFPRW